MSPSTIWCIHCKSQRLAAKPDQHARCRQHPKVQQQPPLTAAGTTPHCARSPMTKKNAWAYAFQFDVWRSAISPQKGFSTDWLESIQLRRDIGRGERRKVFEALDSGSLKETGRCRRGLGLSSHVSNKKMDQLLGPIRQFAHKLLWSVE